jgi:hypothetical protein
MAKSHDSGQKGESEIVRDVGCPNCGARLMKLPSSFSLFDVQCVRCLFRAQVKTARCKPKGEIFGAGWSILEKNLKAGHMIPPLIVNFQWKDRAHRIRRMVYFFPFLTSDNIRRRQRSKRGKRPGYKEFNYVGLFDDNVPRKLLLETPFRRPSLSEKY